MNHLVSRDAQGGEAWLTTDSPVSHYGCPVLRISAADVLGDFGPADMIDTSGDPARIHPDRIITAADVVAGWAMKPERTPEETAAARKFLQQWPEGPQILEAGDREPFQHAQLDGTWARLLSDGTLEMRDPNDGQDPDPDAKCRYQYRVLGGVLHRRRLPPQAVGDVWRGADGPDPFTAVDAWPPIPGILDSFWRHHGGDPVRFALDGARGIGADDTLPMESAPHCVACHATVKPGDGHHDVDLDGQRYRRSLCAACWSKVERGGRTPRQTVEAVLLSYDPNFDGGPDDPCDHEDYRDLQLLGLWPEGEG